jgi:outer membrane receptor protein involved in Fe transport
MSGTVITTVLRLSYTYSAPYRIADFNGGVQPQFRTSAKRTNMDFSANFRVNDNVTVSFDATNILDSRQREYAGTGAINELLFPTSLSRFDRTFSLGARFKL